MRNLTNTIQEISNRIYAVIRYNPTIEEKTYKELYRIYPDMRNIRIFGLRKTEEESDIFNEILWTRIVPNYALELKKLIEKDVHELVKVWVALKEDIVERLIKNGLTLIDILTIYDTIISNLDDFLERMKDKSFKKKFDRLGSMLGYFSRLSIYALPISLAIISPIIIKDRREELWSDGLLALKVIAIAKVHHLYRIKESTLRLLSLIYHIQRVERWIIKLKNWDEEG